jgi:hypothetical protein
MCTTAQALAKTESNIVRPRAGRILTRPKVRPALASRDDAAASTASHPNVRDDRDTSLVEG